MKIIKVPYGINDNQLLKKLLTDILPEAVESLDEDASPEWGSMSTQHMVEHLLLSFKMSTGSFNVDCHTPEEKLSRIQAFLRSNRPMPKGFQNPLMGNQLPELHFKTIEEAKTGLNREKEKFLHHFEENPEATYIHPVFGELDIEDWEKFHFKHCFNHLSQFGLVERAGE